MNRESITSFMDYAEEWTTIVSKNFVAFTPQVFEICVTMFQHYT